MTEIIISEPTAITSPASYSADKHPALVYLASIGASSRRTMGQSLNAIAATLGLVPVHNDDGKEITYMFVPWGVMRYEHTQAIRTQLAERYSATTANRHLSALRGVLKDAWRLGYMSAEDYQRAVDLKPIKGEKVKQAETGRHLDSGEIKGLIDSCNDGTAAGWRDGAIIAVGYGCGLRRSEIANLDLADYDSDNGSLKVRAGKGNKERIAYLPGGAVAAIAGWLAIRGQAAGPLFYSIRRGDHVESKGLTDQAVYNILASRATLAGVKAFTPHDLRRTFAGDLLDAGEDISTVQKMMGHSNVNTTAGYDRRDSRAKKKAASKLHVPYRGQLV
jgi:integrase